MSRGGLHTRILRDVSRSFYLSVRVLPKSVRVPVSIAYLLARTSDTIADTTSVSPSTRLRRLADFESLLRGAPGSHALNAIQRDIKPEHRGERALIRALPEVLQAFTAQDMWAWNETSALMANIIRGQTSDLETFGDVENVVALRSAAELEDYIYLVAGCVGEWWTRVCLHHLPKYSRVPEGDLMHLAANFGKALQLVNILRDLSVDLGAGRCYLPADELEQLQIDASVLRTRPELAQPVCDHWLARARDLLNEGRLYIAAVRSRRVRLACYIPWRLAAMTLDLLERQSPLTHPKQKVSRATVRRALWEGIGVAFFGRSI